MILSKDNTIQDRGSGSGKGKKKSSGGFMGKVKSFFGR